MKYNKVLILVNTGTPDSYKTRDVRKYLSEFLNDKRVIDLPWLIRKILVNIIIVPFRAPGSALRYKKIWTERGSPLKANMEDLVEKVQSAAGKKLQVKAAFRYGNPSLTETLRSLKADPPDEISILPLFPQYASSTTGSIYEIAVKELSRWEKIPEFRIMGQFYSNPRYINALCEHIKTFSPETFDFVLFSYHSLPQRHIRKIHPLIEPENCDCTDKMPGNGRYCYKAICYESTRLLASGLNLGNEKWGTSFQSGFTRKWIGPFTDERLAELAQSGKKKVLVISPSFIADCLETLTEIDNECRQVFLENGGVEFRYAGSLNADPKWVEAVIAITGI